VKAANILFTGPPRRGKSTLIECVVKEIKRPATGFFTRDITEKGNRVGFSIDTLDTRDKLFKKLVKSYT
jgi:nucleoside-triphosphatase THEP1